MFTAAPAARLGRDNHTYFDARILTDGEEMRICTPTLHGRVVYSAQEQASDKEQLLGDLVKKLDVAEGILGRLS